MENTETNAAILRALTNISAYMEKSTGKALDEQEQKWIKWDLVQIARASLTDLCSTANQAKDTLQRDAFKIETLSNA